MMDLDRYRRLVLLGTSGVGKSSLVRRLFFNMFDPVHRPTAEEFHRKVFVVNDVLLYLEVTDTSGRQDYPAMRQLALQKGEGFILVFSYDQPSSLDEILGLRDAVREIHPDAYFLVVGNKLDLPPDERKIQRELAETLVCCDWELPFLDCSARTGQSVDSILEKISRVWGVPNLNANLGRPRRLSLPIFSSHFGQRRRSSVIRTLGKRDSCMMQ